MYKTLFFIAIIFTSSCTYQAAKKRELNNIAVHQSKLHKSSQSLQKQQLQSHRLSNQMRQSKLRIASLKNQLNELQSNSTQSTQELATLKQTIQLLAKEKQALDSIKKQINNSATGQ